MAQELWNMVLSKHKFVAFTFSKYVCKTVDRTFVVLEKTYVCLLNISDELRVDLAV